MNALNHDAFGDMLKTLRKSKKISQQHLADRLGVHRNTIGAWERGENLPDSRGMVLELARHLRLDEEHTRQLLEASLTAPVPYWSVPIPRNPLFTGREEILESLHTRLDTERIMALVQSHALHGLGGVGKTQLAVEYAYRYALEYSAVLWVGAESTETIMSSFLALADLLKLPERQETDQQRLVSAVQRWLTHHHQWLLIWDNLEDPELLQRFLPPARQGAILITTRRPSLGTLAHPLELAPLTQEEGALLLLRRTNVLPTSAPAAHSQDLSSMLPAEYATARELALLMGGLPLALDQAGAYVEETGCKLVDYQQRYKQQRAHLLARRGTPAGNHPHSVTATFTLAFQRLEREQPIAAEILRVCAFLHAENIPEELFLAGASHLGPTLECLADDPYQLDLALATLRASALIQRQSENSTISLHRLVQAVLQAMMSEQEQALWQQRVICALNALFPKDSDSPAFREEWQQCERLLFHALTCIAAIPEHTLDQELAEVLRKAANHLYQCAQYEQAEALFQRALRIQEQVSGSLHLSVAQTMYNLATLYADQGKYAQAEALYYKALHIREQMFGPDHPQVAETLNNLANLYYGRGEYQQAKLFYQRILHIRELTSKPDHPDIAYPLNNLALISYEEGKYDQAELLYQQALHIWEQGLGFDHPKVANALLGLGRLYYKQGKYEQAEAFYQRTLCIHEQSGKSDHPDAAYVLNNLGAIYMEQAKYEQAQAVYERTRRIRERALGPDHPRMVYPLTGLAQIYSIREQYEQAESLYQQALRIGTQAWGPDHPNITYPLNQLAILYFRQGKYEQAELLYQRALHINEQVVGSEHPDVALILDGLAHLYTEQRKYEKAELLYQQTLHIWKRAVGFDHPQMTSPLNGLANLHREQGKYEQAEALYQRALTIREQRLGPQHPDTAQTLHDFALCLQRQEKFAEAAEYFQRALEIRLQALGDAHPHTIATRTAYAALLRAPGHEGENIELE